MNRREMLCAVVGAAGVALAGCTDGSASSQDDAGEDTPAGSETTTEPAPTLEEASLSVTEVAETPPDSPAAVEFDHETATVTVTGTIQGSDGCKTAVLEDATYDPDRDDLTVAVATEDRPDAQNSMCTAALVYIDYEVTAAFDGGLPGSVTVSHDGEEVASGGYGTGAGGDG